MPFPSMKMESTYGSFADDGNQAMVLTESYRPNVSAMEYEAQWPDGCTVRRLVPSEMLGTTYLNMDLLKEDICKKMRDAHDLQHIAVEERIAATVASVQPIVRRYCSLEG